MLGEAAKHPLWFAQKFREPSQPNGRLNLGCSLLLGNQWFVRHPRTFETYCWGNRIIETITSSGTSISMIGQRGVLPSMVIMFRGYRGHQIQRRSKWSPGECMWTIWTLATGSGGLSLDGLNAFGIGHLESPGPPADLKPPRCWLLFVLFSSTANQFIIMFPLKRWDVLGGIPWKWFSSILKFTPHFPHLHITPARS